MKKKTRWPIYLIISLVVIFVAFTVPLPYYIEVPGTSEDIRKVLQVMISLIKRKAPTSL